MNATPTTRPRRLLVVTLADLGDALLVTPALQALRQARPDAHITVLTTPVGAAALAGLPCYDALLCFEKARFNDPRSLARPTNLWAALQLWRHLRAGRYDACVLLHHLTTWFGTLKYAALAQATAAPRRYGLDNGRGFFLTERVPDAGFGVRHQAEYWLAVVERLGAVPGAEPPLPIFHVPAAAEAWAADLLTTADRRPLIALHPGSGAFAPARRWPAPRWAALADALISSGCRVLLVGGVEEAELRRSVLGAMRHAGQVIDLGGRTTLPELGALLRRCTLMIGNDSGLTHLAASVGTPVLGIFGPTDPRAWGPYGGEPWTVRATYANGVELLGSGPHRALRAAIACSPCLYRGQRLGTPWGCPDRTCLRRIDVEQVLAVARRRLGELEPVCALPT